MTTPRIEFEHEGERADGARQAYGALRRELGKSAHVAYRYPVTATGSAALAVRVALAANRPLLLRGVPGSGKSTLAEDAAVCLGWPYYERVITSRTEARDLLYSFDAVRRLGDAQARVPGVSLPALSRYIEPGALWWAFDPDSAARRGSSEASPDDVADPARWQARSGEGAVVLLDEIDKAEPDMPNDLLVPLGAQCFEVPEVPAVIEARRRVLVVITTNGERDLPPAFLRRCVVYELPKPDRTTLRAIARVHHPDVDEPLLNAVLTRFEALVEAADEPAQRAPGTAELLDALSACKGLGIGEASPGWLAATRSTLWKNLDAPPGEGPGDKEKGL